MASSVRAALLHSALRWCILRLLSPTQWSSLFPAMPVRCCTRKTLTSGWSCQSMLCCVTRTMKLPWQPPLILACGTMYLTWWDRRTQPPGISLSSDDDTGVGATTAEGDEENPPAYPCQGTTFFKSCMTLSPGLYENIRQMLERAWWWETDSILVQLPHCQKQHHEKLHGSDDTQASSVPAPGLPRQGDGAAGQG